MRSVVDHRARVAALGVSAPVRTVAVHDVVGTVLADDVHAPVAVPAFDVSAVDGFAFGVDDLQTHPELTVRSARVAGPVADDETPVAPGSAVQIMTGAQVPIGADVVVPVESTSGFVADVSCGWVRISGSWERGANIRPRGGDIGVGEKVLTEGTVLAPHHIGALAALGRVEVRVRGSLRVAVVSTGDELVPAGSELRPGQIHESNSAMIAADLAACGVSVHREPVVGDDIAGVRAALDRCAVTADIIVTTGGVSAGTEDVVRLALERDGVEFTSVAMKPGRPQGAGHVRGVPIVCLPGNPVSSLVSYEVFVRPVIRAASGRRCVDRPSRTMVLHGADVPARAGVMQYRLGRRHGGRVSLVGAGSSGSIRSLATADCLVVVGPAGAARGSLVETWLLDHD